MKKILAISAIGIGLYLIFVKAAADRKASVKAWLIRNANAGEKGVESIVDEMTDSEIKLVYDTVVMRIYGNQLPDKILVEFNNLSIKYNIFT